MGRVQADLPENPKSADGSGAPAADDLLAQLAGEDIDRLLAEAEVETAPLAGAAPTHASAPKSASADSAEQIQAEDLDALLKEMNAPEASIDDASVTEPAVDAASANLSAGDDDEVVVKIDILQEELDYPAPETTATPASEFDDEEDDIAAEVAPPEATPPPDVPVASETHDDAEPTAFTPPLNDGAAVAPAAQEDAPEVAPAFPSAAIPSAVAPKAPADPVRVAAKDAPAAAANGDDGPLPFYIRLLKMINSPLDAFPDSFRSAMGKVALVTFFNAAALIGYVLLFRRK